MMNRKIKYVLAIIISLLCVSPVITSAEVIELIDNNLSDTYQSETTEIVYGLSKNEIYNMMLNDPNISNSDKSVIEFELQLQERIFEWRSIASENYITSTYYDYGYVRKMITVSSSYKPTAMFYTKWQYSQGNPTPDAIVSVLNASLNRSYNDKTKQFSGTLFYHLEAYNKLFFELNGDFYDNGTTTYSGGVSIGISENSSIKFSVTYSSNHYKYIFYPYRFIFSLWLINIILLQMQLWV